jgi:hypothetical protein
VIKWAKWELAHTSERECNATLCTFRSENELERSSTVVIK